ncbi:uncharacterized protein LOC128963968 [Oppia nitens]|uniref:uncharacterized protein LOC128963968 n=1 Tax=Oppia nitens TaxID=1686743 RepID=UPI0023DA95B8|nr:uncharacterized protein LOC128963968 [Oppia nitens]
MSSSDNNLPRGLVTRSGGTKRLPALRPKAGESLPSVMQLNGAADRTKNGTVKRVFKPTIPQRRQTTNTDDGQRQTNDNHSNHKYDHRVKREKPISKKRLTNLIQCDGAVFRGEETASVRIIRPKGGESYARNQSTHESSTRVKSEIKTEPRDELDERLGETKLDNKAKVICKLYGDNFIDDTDDRFSNKDLIYPKGWHNVSTHRQSPQPSKSEPLNSYNLLKTNGSHDKLLLMQISEEFLKKGSGYVGKLRVYKSGRIELVDSSSDMKFDILFDQKSITDPNIKDEKTDSKVGSKRTNNCFAEVITEDIVSFDGKELSTLTTLDHKQVLLAVPHMLQSEDL